MHSILNFGDSMKILCKKSGAIANPKHVHLPHIYFYAGETLEVEDEVGERAIELGYGVDADSTPHEKMVDTKHKNKMFEGEEVQAKEKKRGRPKKVVEDV